MNGGDKVTLVFTKLLSDEFYYSQQVTDREISKIFMFRVIVVGGCMQAKNHCHASVFLQGIF